MVEFTPTDWFCPNLHGNHEPLLSWPWTVLSNHEWAWLCAHLETEADCLIYGKTKVRFTVAGTHVMNTLPERRHVTLITVIHEQEGFGVTWCDTVGPILQQLEVEAGKIFGYDARWNKDEKFFGQEAMGRHQHPTTLHVFG